AAGARSQAAHPRRLERARRACSTSSRARRALHRHAADAAATAVISCQLSVVSVKICHPERSPPRRTESKDLRLLSSATQGHFSPSSVWIILKILIPFIKHVDS